MCYEVVCPSVRVALHTTATRHESHVAHGHNSLLHITIFTKRKKKTTMALCILFGKEWKA